MSKAYSVTLVRYSISDTNKDSAFDAGELIIINPVFRNVLSALENARVVIETVGNYEVDFLKNELILGSMASLAQAEPVEPVAFYVPDNIPVDYTMPVEFKIYEGDTYINSLFIEIVLRPSYRTMSHNNISVTFNGRGNIAFNDYPSNRQGIGFKYKDSKSILFEGAMMVGANGGKVANVARGTSQSGQDKSFNAYDVFTITDLNDNIKKGSAYFDDKSAFSTNPGVIVKQTVLQSDAPGFEDIIFLNYKIINNSGNDYDSLFAGLFFDWDIGPSGRPNVTFLDETDSIGYDVNTSDSSMPKIGAILLTEQPLNFFAIDNDGETADNPGIYDGFELSEKWEMLSSGIKRKISDTTDASMVIGAGPINIKNGDTALVSFALLSSFNQDDIKKAANNARLIYSTLGVNENTLLSNNEIISIYPNPTVNSLNIEFNLLLSSEISLNLVDLSGREIMTIFDRKQFEAGKHNTVIDISNIANGIYLLKYSNGKNTYSTPIIINR
jgi:hypothetical protein